ncbi:hypothetical protein [Absidia glauca]|uniref:Reverse transcriptase domain-containing protein n=1 Tax=Absidia glauca TaxID=4829 RepID=A0A168NSY7_ABSGL|nr:hypothetical protein [Absidia glauca]
MVANGVLKPATHEGNHGGWSFPALCVKKKDGTKRLCVQFQKLNDITVKDSWPLLWIVDVLESFQGSKVFATLDLLKGFNQVRVAEDSKTKL